MKPIEIPKESRFSFNFNNSKILMIPSSSEGDHFTVHLGLNSKMLDIHKTNQALKNSDKNPHESLIILRHFTVGRILVHIKREVPNLFRLLFSNRITVSKLKKMNCLVMQLNDEDLQKSLFKTNGAKTKMKMRKNIQPDVIDKSLKCPCILNSVKKNDSFMVFRNKRNRLVLAGSLISFPQKRITKEFIFLSTKKFLRIGKIFSNKIEKIVERETSLDNQELLKKELQRKINKATNNS